jgi:hypothetical protein
MFNWLKRRRAKNAAIEGLSVAKELEAEGDIPPFDEVTKLCQTDLKMDDVLAKQLKPAWYVQHDPSKPHAHDGKMPAPRHVSRRKSAVKRKR